MANIEDVTTATAQPDAAKTVLRPHVGTQAYSTRKTAAQGMLDLALLITNASQLKMLIEVPSEYRDDVHFLLLVLLSCSVALQFIVGVIIVMLGSMDVKQQRDHDIAQKLNNATVAVILIITIVNVYIGVFVKNFIAISAIANSTSLSKAVNATNMDEA